ncbi:hypothetical protein Rs2_40570 [Raphanus sativus]|nr:hypothetical protein Rs2_40570 [Raphanus sativus]
MFRIFFLLVQRGNKVIVGIIGSHKSWGSSHSFHNQLRPGRRQYVGGGVSLYTGRFPRYRQDTNKSNPTSNKGGSIHRLKEKSGSSYLVVMIKRALLKKRQQIRQRRRLQYASWKQECKQMFPVFGSGRFITAPVITAPF